MSTPAPPAPGPAGGRVRHDVLPNGATLAWARYGTPGAPTVVVLHGLVGSIESERLAEALDHQPLSFLFLARPGYGGSDPFPMAAVVDWARQLGPFLAHRAPGAFDVLAFSAGAPYAYSLAAVHPQRVRRVYVNGGLPALFDPAILPLYGDHAEGFYGAAPDTSDQDLARQLDQTFFGALTVEQAASADVRDARAHQGAGMVREARLQAVDWGFELSTLPRPVTVVHSRADGAVPLVAAQRTAALLPEVDLVVLDEGDHCDDASIDWTIERIVADHAADPSVHPLETNGDHRPVDEHPGTSGSSGHR